MNQKGQKILKAVYSMESVSRPKLLQLSRYTPPTLYRIIDELVREEVLVVSGTEEEGGKGRPTDLISVNGAKGHVLALHISRTSFASAVMDFSNKLLAARRHAITPSLTPAAWLDQVEQDAREMCAEQGLMLEHFCGVGLAAVGPLDYKRGLMLEPLYFASPHWHQVPIAALVQQRFGLPTRLDCNARAALMGHYRCEFYEQYKNLAYITVGTGIGSGLVLNRRLDTNTHVVLDGLAHMVIDIDGRKCTCGEYGCVESYVSTPAIVGQCVQALRMGRASAMQPRRDSLTFEDVCEAAAAGDALAVEQLGEAAAILAKCIVNYLRMVSLDAVILGGSLLEHLPWFFDQVQKIVAQKGLGVALHKARHEADSILHGIGSEVVLQLF